MKNPTDNPTHNANHTDSENKNNTSSVNNRFLWFKDFCVVMGFVTDIHPWCIDYLARVILNRNARSKQKDKLDIKVKVRMAQIKRDIENDV